MALPQLVVSGSRGLGGRFRGGVSIVSEMGKAPGTAPAQGHPRLRGALLVLFWGGLAAVQVWTKIVSGRALCAAPVFLLYGLWLVAVGEPRDPVTGEPAAWGQVGAWLAGVVGIALSIAVALLL